MTKHNTTTAEPTSRRAFIGMASGLAAATIATGAVAAQSAKAAGKADKLDAELLELGRQFDALWPVHLAAREKWKETEAAFEGEAVRHRIRPASDAWWALSREMGADSAGAENNSTMDSLDAIAKAIRAIPPTTFAGLQVWVKATAFDTFHLYHFEEDEEDMDYDHFTMLLLYREVERLAGEEVRA